MVRGSRFVNTAGSSASARLSVTLRDQRRVGAVVRFGLALLAIVRIRPFYNRSEALTR